MKKQTDLVELEYRIVLLSHINQLDNFAKYFRSSNAWYMADLLKCISIKYVELYKESKERERK